MSDIFFRAATPSDGHLITEFQLAMALETEGIQLDQKTCASGVDAVFGHPDKGRYFVAVCDDQVIASVLLTYEWSDWRNGTIWWLQSVYVVPTYRGRGVFRGLFRFVQQLAAADPSVRGLRLYVDQGNSRAQTVYRRLGMNGDHYQVFEWMK